MLKETLLLLGYFFLYFGFLLIIYYSSNFFLEDKLKCRLFSCPLPLTPHFFFPNSGSILMKAVTTKVMMQRNITMTKNS